MVQGYRNETPATYQTNLGEPPVRHRCAVNCNNSQGVFGFHTGGANVAMADGSVRFLSTSTSVAALMFLATRDGGEVMPDCDLPRPCPSKQVSMTSSAPEVASYDVSSLFPAFPASLLRS